METRRNVFLWALYDYANSIVSIVFFLYFAQWLVIDQGVKDLYFNLGFTASALLLLLTAPITGSLLDSSWRRITGLRYTTIFTALLYSACAVFALLGNTWSALILFILGLYAYLLSFTFYTPLLNDIVRPAKRGLVSGIGITANYLGQITGLLIVLPFSTGSWSLFGGAPRAETLLPAVIVFFILALPTLFFFNEPRKISKPMLFKERIATTLKETRMLFSLSSVSLFLLAYFLFNDAILTAGNNFPIFLEQVWRVSDTVKTFILLGILITSAIGGWISGIIADRWGHKRTLMWVLAGYLILFPVLALLTNFVLMVITATLFGLWYGATWAVSRSVMAYIAPKDKNNLAFAYFGLAERASSLLGPIVWGLVVSGLVMWGSMRYRLAVIAITVFIVLGLLVLTKVRDDRSMKQG